MSVSYEESGVSREEGYKAVSLMKEVVAKTMNNNVLNNIGSFGAMYELGKYNNPVLVSGTDGVGTKLEIALTIKNMILLELMLWLCVLMMCFVMGLNLFSF